MPLMRVGKTGWKYGRSGHVYRGSSARALAARQGRAISLSKARASGHRISRK